MSMNMSMSMNMFGNNNNKIPRQGTVGEKVVMTRSARGTDRSLAKDDRFDGSIDLPWPSCDLASRVHQSRRIRSG